MIIKLLRTFNVDTIREIIGSSNNGINYTVLREMKVLIKHGEKQNNPIVK